MLEKRSATQPILCDKAAMAPKAESKSKVPKTTKAAAGKKCVTVLGDVVFGQKFFGPFSGKIPSFFFFFFSANVFFLSFSGSVRRAKDPNAPKRPLSAYMIFSNESRGRITTANPGLKLGEVRLEREEGVVFFCVFFFSGEKKI